MIQIIVKICKHKIRKDILSEKETDIEKSLMVYI